MLELGVCYYPEQCSSKLWAEDAKRMVDLGIKWVRIAEFSWSEIEKTSNKFNWQWLDNVIDILGEAGLDIVMSTPTAAPPKWLVDLHPDILPVNINGVTRKFGARRHYCFSSEKYLELSKNIALEYAKRYGQNKYIKAWQIDNEYGDHDTILSYSENAKFAFRNWLKTRYDKIDALNAAWGTSFWSMNYNQFDEIDLPNNLVEEPSPTHLLDFYRFSSDQVCKYNQAQIDILREYSPGRKITHNFMGNHTAFDHYKLAENLDFASWDSYPMGTIIYSNLSDEEKNKHLRTGLPDQPAFHHDLYRHVGKGNVWVMEQQPGPVNWAEYNQSPADGMVRLWSWLAYAHGVDVVCYFRWRQVKFAQEQFHAAILLPNGQPDQAFFEIQQIVKERKTLLKNQVRKQAKVGLVLDYASHWSNKILPQGKDYSSILISSEWYSTLSKLGVDVDIISPDSELDGYQIVFIPDMILDNDQFVKRAQNAHVKLFLGTRVGSKTENMHIPDQLPPGSFGKLIDLKVTRVESLPSYAKQIVVFNEKKYETSGWRESVETSEQILATCKGDYRNGAAALVGNEKIRYMSIKLEGELLTDVFKDTLNWANIDYTILHEDIRMTNRGDLTFAFNFGNRAIKLDILDKHEILFGSNEIAPIGVTVWRDNACSL